MQNIKNQEMGHSTKGKNGQMEKTSLKKKNMARKAQGKTPHIIGNKTLSKKNNQWHPISKRWTLNTWHILKHLTLIKFSKEIFVMTIEIKNHWSNNKTSIIDWHKCSQPTK